MRVPGAPGPVDYARTRPLAVGQRCERERQPSTVELYCAHRNRLRGLSASQEPLWCAVCDRRRAATVNIWKLLSRRPAAPCLRRGGSAVFTTAGCSLAGGSVRALLGAGQTTRFTVHCPQSTVLRLHGTERDSHPCAVVRRLLPAAAPVCSLGICRSIVHPARNAVAHVYCSKEPPGTGTGTPCLSHASLAVAICTPGPSIPSFNVKCPRHANWLRTISIISAVVTVFTCCGTLHALFAVTTEMLLSRTF